MAGVLSFALGLESTAFSAALDRAGGRLLAFLSIAGTVKASFDNIEKSLNQGGAYSDLSARTGESVQNLYQLGEAAEVAGVSVDAVPAMINRLNKSLSGVGEMGENTAEVFAALGLNVKELAKLQAPEQFKAIAAAMAGMDRGSKVDVASRLFGREGAGNFLQLTADFQGFITNLDNASQRAEQVARTASAFDRVGDRFVVLTKRWDASWGSATNGLLPFINRFQRYLEAMPIESIGKRFEHVFLSADKMAAQGKFGEFVDLSLQVAFEKAGFYAVKLANTLAFSVLSSLPPAIAAAVDIGMKLPGTGLIGLGDTIASEMMRAGLEAKLALEEKAGNVQGAAATRKALAGLNAHELETASTMDQATKQLIHDAMLSISAATMEGLRSGKASWATGGSPPVTDTQRKLDTLVGHVLSPTGDAGKATARNSEKTWMAIEALHKTVKSQQPQSFKNQ